MSSPISYLLAALLSLFFFNFHGSKANYLGSPNCPITNCSNGLKFHYPFWKMEDNSKADDKYCGYPGFGLKCSGSGEPILGLPNNDSIYVKDIAFTLRTITLVDIDVVNQECPRARRSLPFDYSQLDVNLSRLSFYFNCSFNVEHVPVVPPIMYWGLNGNNRSYVFKEGEEPEGFDWSEKCEENVVVTVKETVFTRSIDGSSGAFGVAMNNGSVLNWSMAECGSCKANGGFCGYNNAAREVLCFCKDGSTGTPINGPCKKVKEGTLFLT